MQVSQQQSVAINTKENIENMFSFLCTGVRKEISCLRCGTGIKAELGLRKEKGMEEDFKVIDNYLMVKMPEEIDHHKSSYISENADRFIVRENVSNVVFDFEDTKFMDSSGIGIIMGRYKKISCFGGKVFAINADHRIRRLLMISGLHKIVEIMD